MSAARGGAAGGGARRGGIAGFALRVLAGTLPERARGRYREEWAADLAGAEELGLARAAVIGGALATAISIDRDSPVTIGVPITVEAARRMRWASACLVSSPVLLLGLWLSGGYRIDAPGGERALGWLAFGVGGIALLLAAAGLWLLLRAAMIGVAAYGATRVFWVGVLGLVVALMAAAVLMVPFVGWLGGLIGAITLLLLAAGGPHGVAPNAPLRPLRRVLLALTFTAGAWALCLASILHTYVWNPLAKLPGLTLERIYAELAAEGEGADFGVVAALAILFLLATLVLPVLSATRTLGGPGSTRRIVVLGLLMIAATGGFAFFIGFGMGMGVADAFGTSGGDAAPSGPLISVIAQFAWCAAIFAGLAPASRLRYRDPAQMADGGAAAPVT